jgi:hypothetical protein
VKGGGRDGPDDHRPGRGSGMIYLVGGAAVTLLAAYTVKVLWEDENYV